MQFLGATVVPVYGGSQTLKDATNEAMRDWIHNAATTHYVIGSVVGPDPFPDMVAFFQSVISAEVKQQLIDKTLPDPDMIIASVGGGSNAIGIFYHFLCDAHIKLIGIEAAGRGIDSGEHAATITKGSPGVLHGCKSLLLQDRLGQIQEPHSISAGLDYPGVGPIHAHLHSMQRVQYHAVTDQDALRAARLLGQKEGILPALESAHALAYLNDIDCAGMTIVINLSGRGDKDLATYMEYM
jgi:tryptophan synthase beta chain